MNQNLDQFKFFITMFTSQIPILIVCLAACLILLTRWKDRTPGMSWALLGFGLAAALGIVMPIFQTLTQVWVMGQGSGMAERGAILTVLSMMWSVLRAVTYGLLAVAVLIGRPKSQTQPV